MRLAFRIRSVGEENQVPIVENPPLARALYASVEVDAEIPAEHYKAVAEVVGLCDGPAAQGSQAMIFGCGTPRPVIANRGRADHPPRPEMGVGL